MENTEKELYSKGNLSDVILKSTFEYFNKVILVKYKIAVFILALMDIILLLLIINFFSIT